MIRRAAEIPWLATRFTGQGRTATDQSLRTARLAVRTTRAGRNTGVTTDLRIWTTCRPGPSTGNAGLARWTRDLVVRAALERSAALTPATSWGIVRTGARYIVGATDVAIDALSTTALLARRTARPVATLQRVGTAIARPAISLVAISTGVVRAGLRLAGMIVAIPLTTAVTGHAPPRTAQLPRWTGVCCITGRTALGPLAAPTIVDGRAIRHPGATKDRIRQVRIVGDDRSRQIGIDQARSAEIGFGQVRVPEIGAAQVRLGDIAARAIGRRGGVVALQVALAGIRSLLELAGARAPAVSCLCLRLPWVLALVVALATVLVVFAAFVFVLAMAFVVGLAFLGRGLQHHRERTGCDQRAQCGTARATGSQDASEPIEDVIVQGTLLILRRTSLVSWGPAPFSPEH